MKLKIKLFLSTVFALAIVFSSTNIQAQHKHKHAHAKKKAVHHKKAVQHNKVKVARKVAHKNNIGQSVKVIKRTNDVIINANKAVQKHHVHTGNLSRALHHQQYAKKMLRLHKTHSAMQHSRLARKYAFKAIRSNKGNIPAGYEINAEEQQLMGEAIADAELDKELKKSNPKMTFDDSKITAKELTDLEVIDLDPSDYKTE